MSPRWGSTWIRTSTHSQHAHPPACLSVPTLRSYHSSRGAVQATAKAKISLKLSTNFHFLYFVDQNFDTILTAVDTGKQEFSSFPSVSEAARAREQGLAVRSDSNRVCHGLPYSFMASRWFPVFYDVFLKIPSLIEVWGPYGTVILGGGMFFSQVKRKNRAIASLLEFLAPALNLSWHSITLLKWSDSTPQPKHGGVVYFLCFCL